MVKWLSDRPKFPNISVFAPIWDGLLGDTAPKRGEDMSGTQLCHRAKCHTNQLRHRREKFTSVSVCQKFSEIKIQCSLTKLLQK